MIVQVNKPLVLQAGLDTTGLFVAATVFDWNTNSPVQVGAVIPMTNYVGNTYAALFTPTAQHAYSYFIAVYTDGTYTTIVTDEPQGSGTFEAVDLSTGGGGGSGGGCELVGIINDNPLIGYVMDSEPIIGKINC